MNTHTSAPPPTGRHKVCPWWLGYFLDNPLRRMIHPPEKVLGPYIMKGMTVLDFGCGFGHYSLGMARLTGEAGQVMAADIQQKMLDKTMARARKAGLGSIIRPLLCNGNGIGERLELDFALASNSLHETPDPVGTLTELFGMLKSGSRFLLMEPSHHLSAEDFEAEVALATQVGFVEIDRPVVTRERSALLKKPAP